MRITNEPTLVGVTDHRVEGRRPGSLRGGFADAFGSRPAQRVT